MTPASEPTRQALAGLHDSAYRWALACCGYQEDRAREIVQMVYLEILRGQARFHGRSSLKTWLFAVVRNTARRLAAGDRRARAAEARLALVSGEANGTACDAAEQAADHRHTRLAILAALRALPLQQRQIVELVYFHDLSVREAATVMGITVGTAGQHFHRAKRALSASLSPLREVLGDG